MTSQKRISPFMAEAMLELGVAYSNNGNDDKALAKYKELVKNYPQSSEAKDALVAIKAIYVSKGDAQSYISYIGSIGGENGIDAGEKEALSYDALQRQFIAGNYDRVVALSGDYKEEFPNGVHSVDVEYYLSEALIATKSDKAAAQLENLIAMPNNQYTIVALENAVKLYASKSMNEQQHAVLVKLYSITTNPSQKKETLEQLMELAVKIGSKDLVASSAEMVFADKDASEKALSYAHFGNGRVLYDKGDYAAAIKELTQANIPAGKAVGVQNKFLIADAMFRNGDVKGSEKMVIELSNLETPHQYWVARGFILYGDIYKKKGDLFQAKATYQSILEGYEKKTDGIIETV
ncbi:MAG: tetratricopeptide repeat protein, partial [Rikenellaceae bacterium]